MRKKQIVFLLILCMTLLSGCQFTGKDDLPNDFTKAEQIVISDSASVETLAVLTGADEIKAFCQSLDGKDWDITEDVPAESKRECTFDMYQTETLKAGMNPEDAEMVLLCTMYTYRDSSCFVMEFPFASFPFALPDDAAAYLHSFAK